ncbi:MAG: caspase family protein, partial [Candidatus Electrothrix sp. AUS4]|nr:caspase family protein [Candidatus Electrothrix sp. AUS4]
MNKNLIVTIFVPSTGQEKRGKIGTGYPVAEDLILTSRHVIDGESGEIQVRWHYYADKKTSSNGWIILSVDDIVWKGEGELDAVLLRCPRPEKARGQRWGRVADKKPPLHKSWQSLGFSSATQYANVRDPDDVSGITETMADHAEHFVLNVTSSPENPAMWKGASGMPVFVDNEILGVVGKAPKNFGARKLYAVPSWKMLKDEKFRKLIKAIPDTNKNIFSNGHALIIGVKNYSPPLENLPCTIEDATGLAGILKDEGRCAYPPDQVTLLTDSRADRDGILVALDDLAKNTDADSTVVIYFSGHGGKKDGGYYFCPYKFNSASLQDTAISGQEFKDKIAAIPAKKKLILLDCCHAGGIGSGVKGDGFTKAAVPPEAIELFQQGKGCVVIASSKKDEVSYTGKPYSAFTGALIEALCGQGISEEDSYIMVSDLAMHAARRTPQLTKDKQHPVLRFKEADDFVLAYYAGGEKETKEVSEESAMKNIEKIEDMYVKARSDQNQAFRELYLLCKDVKSCESLILIRPGFDIHILNFFNIFHRALTQNPDT